MAQGWELLLDEVRDCSGQPSLRIPAYSEFMPSPRLYWKPCGVPEYCHHSEADPALWDISEYEENLEIQPGFARIAGHVLEQLARLVRGEASQVHKRLLTGNPAWSDELITPGGGQALNIALPLSISRTQDDKGRVRWTLFGASHHGPAQAFWRSFSSGFSPAAGEVMFRKFLAWAMNIPDLNGELRTAGVRVLPTGPEFAHGLWTEERFPDFICPLLLNEGEPVEALKVLVTFRPFSHLPQSLRRAYREGALQIIPSPISLIFWGEPGYRKLAADLDTALQIPLLHLFERSERSYGIRISQSGWLDETPVYRPEGNVPLHHVRRTHRWQRDGRSVEDILAKDAVVDVQNDPVTIALFSTDPDTIALYNKPLARNAQIWDEDYHLILDGPGAGKAQLEAAAAACRCVGRFGYRFYFPPMQVGRWAVYWHRPLLAQLGVDGQIRFFPEPLLGYISGERKGATPVELAPRLISRPGHREAVTLFQHEPGYHHTARWNVRKILDWSELLGGKLTPAFARRLITAGRRVSLGDWLTDLPALAGDDVGGKELAALLRSRLGEEPTVDPSQAMTFEHTRLRAFEETYWQNIAELSDGRFQLSNNADVIKPPLGLTQVEDRDAIRHRQLEDVRGYFHRYYESLFERHGMAGRAVCADQVFRWETEFDYPWWDGWKRNQDGTAAEANVVVMIPGRNRGEAVLMCDHYDTAYMEDLYEPARGGSHRRLAAPGADDNHSATAALMLAADVLLPLAREGRLERDIWLVHLTGEEFPADCLGSRALVERLIAKDLHLTGSDGGAIDVSGTQVVGAFVLDMVAHNNDREHNVFQIAPGDGPGAARLAWLAHLANQRWNTGMPSWNAAPERRGRGRGRRIQQGEAIPSIAEYPLMIGQIRPEWDPHSTLYNTDGIIFSDAGLPVVLFCEDYELNRHGYHDSEDTMANIDLDYGAALVAIAIESVAQAACE